jgi:hypothetical protein
MSLKIYKDVRTTPKGHTVSADVIGHLQYLSDLPNIGEIVHVEIFSVQKSQTMTVLGEVFAHVEHPSPEHVGWGFALIKFS